MTAKLPAVPTLVQLFANPSSAPGGVETIMRRLAAVAEGLGFHCEEYHLQSFPLRPLSRRFPMLNVPANVWQLNRALQGTLRKADVVITHGMYGAFVQHPRHIYVFHSTYAAMAEAMKPYVPWLDYAFCRYLWGGFLERRNGRVARCVAVSQAVAEEAQRYYKVPSTVIHNAVSLPAAPLASHPLLEGFRASGSTSLLVVGRREKLKGRQILEQLARQFSSSGVQIVSVGSGPGIPGVRCLDPVSPEELQAFYAGADWLLNPSLYEGFGMTVLEAWAAGCPVITFPQGIVKELRGECPGFDGCVAEVSACSEAFAAAIRRALAHPHWRDEQREWARQQVLPRFSPGLFADRWKPLLEGTANAGLR